MHYAIYYIHCHHFHGTDAEKELEWPTFAFTFSCIAFSHISYPFVMMVLPLLPLVVLVPHFYNTICTNACYCTLVLHPTYDIRHTHTLYVCVVLHILLRHIICTWYIYIWCVYEAGGMVWSAWLACHGRLLVWLWCSTLLPAQYAKTDTRSTHTYNAVHIQIWDLLLCAIK